MKRTAALALAVLLAAATACSRYTLKSAPIWDSESHPPQGPVENRVNLWPFVYWRDPVLSVLWPLYTATEQGNALVPLYEYRGDERSLRLGAIHPEFPSLATFDAKNKYTRVLNTVVDREKKTYAFFPFVYKDKDLLTLFPLYFQGLDQNDPSQLVVPLYFHDKDGIWTPLVTWRKDLKGALGPLFCRYNDGSTKKYYAPWPLVAWWSDRDETYWRAFPFYSHKKEGDDSFDHVLAGLGGRSRDGDETANWLFPLWMYDRDPNAYHCYALACLGGTYRETGKSASWALPLWYAQKKGADSTFLSLPYNEIGNGRKTVRNALLNAYVSVSDDDGDYRSVLWPLAHQWNHKDGSGGSAVLPLYLHERGADGVSAFYSPLASFSSDGALRNVGLILYHERNAGGKRYGTALWPFVQWWGDDAGAGGRMVLPVYYDNQSGGQRTVLTPVGAASRGGDLEYTNVLGPLYYESSRPSRKTHYRTVAFPFWHEYDHGDDHTKVLAPLALWEAGPRGHQWISPLYSHGLWSDSQYTNVGLFLFDRRSNSYRTDTSVIWPIFHASSRRDGSQHSWRVFPLTGYTSDRDYREVSSLLNKTWHTRRTDDELREEIRRNFAKRDPSQRIDFKQGFDQRVVDNRFLLGLIGYERSLTGRRDKNSSELKFGERRSGWFFPFVYSHADDRASQCNILWRLYDADASTDDNGDGYTRRRVLWRLYHRETLGPKTSVDAFPFITSDSDTKADTSSWSFCWKLFAYDRKAGDRTLNLFFVPIKY